MDSIAQRLLDFGDMAANLAVQASAIDGRHEQLNVFWGQLNLLKITLATSTKEGTAFRNMLSVDDVLSLDQALDSLEEAKRLPPWKNRSRITESLELLANLLRSTIKENSVVPTKPSVFIGSSVEGIPVAEKLQEGLDYVAESTMWNQGVFGLSGGTLESLVAASKKFDFAILVLGADDLKTKREATRNSPRDNVIFELGLFIGALGRERVYIVSCRDEVIDFPSDLAGITMAKYGKRSDGNLKAALGVVCSQIKDAMKTLGNR